jgi:predicted lipoprotein
MNKLHIFGFLLLSNCLILVSCKKDKKKEEDPKAEFQKSDLLTNIGSNLIVPEYQQLLNDISILESKYIQFSNAKTDPNLEEVKTAWKNGYKSWYSVNIYEFGPAMDIGLRSAVGIYPTDTNKVIANTASSSNILGSASNVDAIGFSCLDFLLYRANALSFFMNSATYTQYGLDVIQKMKNEVSYVLDKWNTTYLATFKSSTGTESTSSFSLFVNEFNKTYELTKNAKLGIPIGKQSLGIQRPEYIEARMSAISLDLLKESVKSLQRIFNGNAKSGTAGIGFDDYLVALERQTLATSIDSQFSAILSDINLLTLSLEAEMTTNPSALDNLYTKMQNLVVSIKTDMASSFGVLITYQDNDGD